MKIQIRGGNSIEIPIKATLIQPKVYIDEEVFDFGSVTLGATILKSMTFNNPSNVDAILFLDLSEYKEFDISYPEQWDDISPEQNKCPIIRILPDAIPDFNDGTLFSPRIVIIPPNKGSYDYGRKILKKGSSFGSLTKMDSLNTINSQTFTRRQKSKSQTPPTDNLDNESENSTELTVYRIIVPSNSNLSFNLQYSPNTANEQTFQLPIMLAGSSKCQGIQRRVHGTGLQPRVTLSNNSIFIDNAIG